MKEKNIAGSYTVEASLLIPIIYFIILALMYMAFYLHDLCKIQAILDQGVLKTSSQMKHNSNIITGETEYLNIQNKDFFSPDYHKECSNIKSYIHNKLRKGLILGKVDTILVLADRNDVTIKIKIKIYVPFSNIKKYITGSGKSLRVERRCSVHNPAEFLRCYEAAAIKKIEENKK